MGLYNDCLLPKLVHLAMRNKRLLTYRQRIVAAAKGRVLEIGIGSGLNLAFYPSNVGCVLGLEPSAQLRGMADRLAQRAPFPVRLLPGSAEHIPLDGHVVDTVVMTWTGCSITNVAAALGEMRRVLRPGGHLLFVEHGLSLDPKMERWQNRITPTWRRISGGCHLNRKIDDLLAEAGFEIETLHTGYIAGPSPFTFMYEGRARPA